MLRQRLKKHTRKIRFHGIVENAKALGVSRVHLYLVLMGQRESKPLMRRYRALKKETQKRKQLK